MPHPSRLDGHFDPCIHVHYGAFGCSLVLDLWRAQWSLDHSFASMGLGALVGCTVKQSLLILFALLFPLALLPQSFVRSRLHCWIAVQVAKYFSFRLLFEELAHATTANMPMTDVEGSSGTPSVRTPAGHGTTDTFGGHTNADSSSLPEGHPHGRPQILVGPPHGVFPYGNLLSMMAWPCYLRRDTAFKLLLPVPSSTYPSLNKSWSALALLTRRERRRDAPWNAIPPRLASRQEKGRSV
jgi:hypothetical protein